MSSQGFVYEISRVSLGGKQAQCEDSNNENTLMWSSEKQEKLVRWESNRLKEAKLNLMMKMYSLYCLKMSCKPIEYHLVQHRS